MEEAYENFDDIQKSSYLFSNTFTAYRGDMLPSQPQQNSTTIYEVEVQDGDLTNILEEKSMTSLKNDKKTNQPNSPPLHEKINAENFERNEEEQLMIMRLW